MTRAPRHEADVSGDPNLAGQSKEGNSTMLESQDGRRQGRIGEKDGVEIFRELRQMPITRGDVVRHRDANAA